jgi:type II secretory pathway pseudopilin PulG
MNRHSWRACDSEAGFSFVELLVTIIIAGVAFSAMVPLFVQAIGETNNDKMRALGDSVARDRIEKLREVPFEAIDTANLNSNTFYFGEFGDSWTEQTESGATAEFSVAYDVQDKPVSATDSRIAYKLVKVTVTWDSDPKHKVVQTTMISRQFAGPQITSFTVAPYDESNDYITSSTVDLTAVVSETDLNSMVPVTVGASTLVGRVDFKISQTGGSGFPTVSVDYDPSSSTPSQFLTTWSVPGGPGVDGYYTFKAVAYTSKGYQGNSWEFSKRVESGPALPVSNLSVVGGDGTAILTWDPSPSLDLDHYEVYRTNPDSTTVRVAGDPDTAPQWSDLGFTDTGLTNGETYTYTVYAYDHLMQQSTGVLQSVVPGTPSAPGPLPASDLQGDASADYANLMWFASSGPDVQGYQVFMDGNETTPVQTVSDVTVSVQQGWGSTHWYQVKPYNSDAVPSSTWASILTGYPTELVNGTPWVKVTTGA